MSTTEIINQTINSIFEDMYFMFPEQIVNPESLFTLPMNTFVATTRFTKDEGGINLYAEDKLVSQMAMNFLGEKRTFEYIELIDIFKEAANVIVGNYITATNKPPEVGFEIPVVEPTRIISWNTDKSYVIDSIYDIEKFYFRITLTGK